MSSRGAKQDGRRVSGGSGADGSSTGRHAGAVREGQERGNEGQVEADPVVAEYDVYLSHALPEELHVLQFPTVPAARATTLVRPKGGRMRTEHRVLEIAMEDDGWQDSEYHQPKDEALLAANSARETRERSFISVLCWNH